MLAGLRQGLAVSPSTQPYSTAWASGARPPPSHLCPGDFALSRPVLEHPPLPSLSLHSVLFSISLRWMPALGGEPSRTVLLPISWLALLLCKLLEGRAVSSVVLCFQNVV